MKKYAVIIGFAGFFLNACAQTTVQSNVPSVVLNRFQQEFPNAMDVEWEMKDNVYEVEFEINRKDHEVWMDSQGKVTSHEQELAITELPETIAAAIRRDFSGFKTTDADKFVVDGKTSYKVEVKNGATEWKASYSEDGTLLQKIPD